MGHGLVNQVPQFQGWQSILHRQTITMLKWSAQLSNLWSTHAFSWPSFWAYFGNLVGRKPLEEGLVPFVYLIKWWAFLIVFVYSGNQVWPRCSPNIALDSCIVFHRKSLSRLFFQVKSGKSLLLYCLLMRDHNFSAVVLASLIYRSPDHNMSLIFSSSREGEETEEPSLPLPRKMPLPFFGYKNHKTSAQCH